MIIREDGKKFFAFDCYTESGSSPMLASWYGSYEKGSSSVENLIAEMDRIGVDMAINFCLGDPHTDYRKENQKCLEDCKKYEGRIFPFVRLNPNFEDNMAEDCERYFAQGVYGVKLDPARDGFWPADDRYVGYPLYEILSKYNALCMIHAGESWNSTPALIGQVAKDFPKLRIIIEHFGYMEYDREAFNLCKEVDNVWLESSRIWPPDIMRVAYQRVGKERILFGSGFPYSCMPAERDKWFYHAGVNDEVQEAVFGKNLANLLGVIPKNFD